MANDIKWMCYFHALTYKGEARKGSGREETLSARASSSPPARPAHLLGLWRQVDLKAASVDPVEVPPASRVMDVEQLVVLVKGRHHHAARNDVKYERKKMEESIMLYYKGRAALLVRDRL